MYQVGVSGAKADNTERCCKCNAAFVSVTFAIVRLGVRCFTKLLATSATEPCVCRSPSARSVRRLRLPENAAPLRVPNPTWLH